MLAWTLITLGWLMGLTIAPKLQMTPVVSEIEVECSAVIGTCIAQPKRQIALLHAKQAHRTTA